ncbi:MAG: hypothetical protein L6435_01245 [Anaerolineae bacterium]|nr:hypothetical protein [Anaerolineae bacterium]
MSKAAKSILVFGIYLVVIGLGFLVVPNTPLALFGFPTTNEPWIRVVGLLLVLLAYYYVQAARSEMQPLFRWTVHTRPVVVVCFIVFVALGLAPPMLIVFGVVDLLGAVWTCLALRDSQA